MKKIFMILCIFVTFIGCVPFKKKEYSYFYLNPKTPICNKEFKLEIYLKEIVALRPYDRKEIFYSLRSYEVRNYIYNKWVNNLSNLLYDIFMDYNGCVKYSNNIHAKYALQIKLKKMLHKIDTKEKSNVEVIMDFYLTDNQTSKLLLKKTYNLSQPCTEQTPFGAVEAFNKVISSILVDFENTVLSM